MKKILFIFIFLILSASQTVLSADNFTIAKNYFNKKDYANANTYLVKAITQYPNNATYRYYYAQTLTYLKNYEQARKEYGYVIQLAPNTQLSEYSKKSISYIDSISKPEQNGQNKQATETGNYLKNAITNSGDLVTWDNSKMPIKVYINNSKHVSQTYVSAAKEALDSWKQASNNLQFLYVTEPQYADITIVFQGMAQKNDNQTLGVTNHNVLNGYMHKVTVTLYTFGPSYKPLTPTDVYNVALHEFGHAIGIAGHSTNKSDIMYATYNPQAQNTKAKLSARDINTAKAIYEIDKNPYSNSLNSINTVLGSKEDRINEKLNQSLEYIKTVPASPIGYVNAGKVYLEQGNEYEAINYFQKALKIAPNDLGANQSLAALYYKRNDVAKAEIYYKKIIQIQPKDPNAYIDLAKLYLRNNKIQNARITMSSLNYRNPAAKNNPEVQQVMKSIQK